MSELAASGERLVVRFKKLFWFVLINLDCQIEDQDERKKELPLSMAWAWVKLYNFVQCVFRLRIIIAERNQVPQSYIAQLESKKTS
jgi:hypothetical protein